MSASSTHLNQRGKPVSKLAEMVIRLCEDGNLTRREMVRQLGVSMTRIEQIYYVALSQSESFRANRDALVLRLRDQEKMTFLQIGERCGFSDCRAAQIYQIARHNIQFPPNGLSKRINRLLTLCGFTVEKQAIATALRAGKLYPGFLPRNYGIYAHRDVCRWAGVDPATLTHPDQYHYETYPDNGLTYRTNSFLKSVGIPATKKAVLQSLKNGTLIPTKRPIGYGKVTHAELCRWIGVNPHQFRNREKVSSQ